jgi:flagellar motility protein MotE (MotC chaperone)
MPMRLWVALFLLGCVGLFGGGGTEACAATREASAPLNLMAVAKSPAPAKAKSAVPGKAKSGTKKRSVAPIVVVVPPGGTNEPNDVTGAIANKDGQAANGSRPAPGQRPAARLGQVPGRPAEPVNPNDAAQFCSNVIDAASDARLAWQMQELEKAESLLRQRIADLEAKRAEYETWLKLRQDFLKKAEDNVVEIYSRMKPDAAALQLASMVDETAAAVLAKLSPRNSSAILNEMEPARAAHLANTLAGLRQTSDSKAQK